MVLSNGITLMILRGYLTYPQKTCNFLKIDLCPEGHQNGMILNLAEGEFFTRNDEECAHSKITIGAAPDVTNIKKSASAQFYLPYEHGRSS